LDKNGGNTIGECRKNAKRQFKDAIEAINPTSRIQLTMEE
jgi:hypothetical protein